jgi:hypothetical protein
MRAKNEQFHIVDFYSGLLGFHVPNSFFLIDWSLKMSAFICSDMHISTIAHFIAPANAQNLANKLKEINIKSVNYRYGEKSRITKCKFNPKLDVNNYDISKLIESWIYQCCEDDSNIEFHAFTAYLQNWQKMHKVTEYSIGRFWTI